MARTYFCWRVCLTFRCGCVEYTATAHRCGPDRDGCNAWVTHKRTDKDCDEHRLGWGLQQQQQQQQQRAGSSGSVVPESGSGSGSTGSAAEPGFVSGRSGMMVAEGETGRIATDGGRRLQSGERGYDHYGSGKEAGGLGSGALKKWVRRMRGITCAGGYSKKRGLGGGVVR
ncbi:ead33028-bbc3-40f1-a987-d29e7433c1d1 [Thermothielavioides terrestris]|uniref:Ead33028-bbc3-40f1-a987-d29e7433c1d1 n=1 Tax=Thermothielavioides terrestris TaxID=2587410 RepID=A0A3S4F3Q4_9PEZI|nr:ead33028-bbc3-40f1-a987-d29e7433c1d1 [Thermothielavioides terrestris]